jgi:hypothetical protein
MSRRSRRRRLARRERARAPQSPEPPPKPVDEARVVARFCHLVGRGVVLDLVPFGPVVDAETPAQLVEETEEWLAAKAEMQRPS